jgi:predicted nucleic acid-binding protein
MSTAVHKTAGWPSYSIRPALKATQRAILFAPLSLHWEVGNALTSAMRRKRIGTDTAQKALASYEEIAIRFVDVPLDRSLTLAAENQIYAYDAYFVVCALALQAPLLTIDQALARIAKNLGVDIMEI